MNYDLGGRTVIVTGGGSGIGRACVRLLLDGGCNVVAADRGNETGDELIEATPSGQRSQLRYVPTDVTDESDVEGLVAHAIGAFGKLDGAINAAGVSPSGEAVHEMDAATWDRNIDVNLRGMFFCLKHEIAAMRLGGAGSIVAITSAAGARPLGWGGEYSAAKAGVNALVRSAAIENGKSGIRINSILPGSIDTPMLARAQANNGRLADISNSAPMGRIGKPEEVALGAIWLLSDAATFVTGAALPIDGGVLL